MIQHKNNNKQTMEKEIKNYREPVPPKGYKMKTIFIKPENETRIAELAKLYGVHKYQIMDGLFTAYWEQYEIELSKKIKKALENYAKDLIGKGDLL